MNEPPEIHFVFFIIMPIKQKTDGQVTNAWCDIVIYNMQYIFGLSLHFWHRVPKTLGIS